MVSHLIGLFVDWLVGFVGFLVHWFGWLGGLSVDQFIAWLVLLVFWLVHWFSFWCGFSCGWSVSRAVGLLFVSLIVQPANTFLESSKEGSAVVSVKIINLS